MTTPTIVLRRRPTATGARPSTTPSRGTLSADSAAISGARRRWVVRRPDGRVVGALVPRGRSYLAYPAVDLFPDASAEEVTVLRLLGACLAEPLESP